MNKSLPTYELKINESTDSIVDAIAFVSEPAIESDFIAFSKYPVNMQFTTNDEKMEVMGAVMIPDLKIYRRLPDGREFNVFFSVDTIREISQVFFKKGLQSNLNLDHSDTSAKSYIFQSFIIDESKGINSPKGLNLPNGSWVIGCKVQDKNVWSDIKAGNRKGFSVEGLFEFFEMQKPEEESTDKEILSTLAALNKLLTKNKK